MARQHRLWEESKIIQLLTPAADAGGRTSGYFKLMDAHKAYIIASINQGNAATIALTPLQATSNAGANSKGLTINCPIVADTNTGSLDALVPQAAAQSFTTDAGVNNKVVVFEIEPDECMDINNGFAWLALQTGASNAANITSAMLVLWPLRYQMQTPNTAMS